MNFIILGAPGSGKGTQAVRFAGRWNLDHVSTGDLLREAVANRSPLGEQVKEVLASGGLVSDEIVQALIKGALAGRNSDTRGWILDGYPRTRGQAQALETILEETGSKLDGVILLEVEAEVIVDRLSNRRTCGSCKAVYNLLNKPPNSQGKCDECGGELVQREDDKTETIRRRLEVYEEQTLPIIDFYDKRSRVYKINGSQDMKGVTEEIARLVGR